MNIIRNISSISRAPLTSLLLASLAPVSCAAAPDGPAEDTSRENEPVTSGATYTIQGVQSGKCVGVAGGSMANAANVEQSACAGSRAQQWAFRDLGNSVFEIKAQHSGQCLDVAYNALDNGANVQQWPCNGGQNQRWNVTTVGNDEYQLVAQNSGKCLDVANFSMNDGGNIQQWGCGGGANQRFRLTQVGSTPTPPASGNPLAGSTFFVDSTIAAAAAEAQTRASGNIGDADLLRKISTHAQGVWLGDWSGDPRAAVSDVIRRAGGTVPILVAYNIPNRDCGNYSAGGARDATAYRAWIDGVAAGIGDAKAVVVLEPDALSLWLDPGQHCSDVTPDLLAYAVSTLKQHANTHVYIDAGTSRWNSADVVAPGLTRAGIGAADGFALNTSYTASTAETADFGHRVSDLLGGKVPFVIDTSRNAKGAPGDSAWCNPWGRGLGAPSTASTGDARIHAFLWVKRPGESDGTCNGGPGAGSWFQAMALDLARNASF